MMKDGEIETNGVMGTVDKGGDGCICPASVFIKGFNA